MSRLERLPPDLSAVLSLLLRRGKRYGEVAGMLEIEERAVHDRAHSALALLAPGQARALSPTDRERLGEYLLGQQTSDAQKQSRALLEESAAARAWAQALASELAPLSTQPLALIPAATRAGAPAPRRRDAPTAAREPTAEPTSAPAGGSPTAPAGGAPRPPAAPQAGSSRVGGAVILGALGVVVVVVVLLVIGVGGGGGGGSHTSTQQASTSTTGADTQTSSQANTSTSGSAPAGAGTTSTGGSAPTHGKALELRPPDPATSKAVGVAYVLTQKSERAFYAFAKGLPAPPSGAFYAVWLEGAATAPAYPLGSLPAANTDGIVEGGGPLPTDASSYDRIVITTETSHHPSHPGPIALAGAFSAD